MSQYVVDANVAVKWFVPEVFSAQAVRLLEDSHHLMAPDLVFPEAGNALWQKVRRQQLTPDQARRALEGITGAPLDVHLTRELSALALELAVQFGCTVYHGCYLGLAITHGCQLVTADARLRDLTPVRYRGHLLPLGALPILKTAPATRRR
jgi:predicted nucleic acid-binding protein